MGVSGGYIWICVFFMPLRNWGVHGHGLGETSKSGIVLSISRKVSPLSLSCPPPFGLILQTPPKIPLPRRFPLEWILQPPPKRAGRAARGPGLPDLRHALAARLLRLGLQPAAGGEAGGEVAADPRGDGGGSPWGAGVRKWSIGVVPFFFFFLGGGRPK